MHTHSDTLATAVEGRHECADVKTPTHTTNDRKIPVAYEEVTLTDDAVGILELERKAAGERPAQEFRRVVAILER